MGGPPPLHTPYAAPLRAIAKFMTAAAAASSGAPAPGTPGFPEAFRARLAATPEPSTAPELQAAIARMFHLQPAHIAAVVSGVDPETRLLFHGHAMNLGEAVQGDTDELSQAAVVIRWLLGVALPSVQSHPDTQDLNTVGVLRSNLAALQTAAKIARPDDTNPAILALKDRAESAAAAAKAATSRLVALGLHETDAKDDKKLQKANSGLTAGIIVLAIVAAVLIAVVIWLVATRQKSRPSSRLPPLPSQQPRGAASLGGAPRSAAGLANPGSGPAVLPSAQDWGFPFLPDLTATRGL